jgi:hypothetical protein
MATEEVSEKSLSAVVDNVGDIEPTGNTTDDRVLASAMVNCG